ncbi:KAP family P-loop domain-containing protein [Ectopseudomonas composti]|uniref:KAP family P-loop domain-containing protein n=1 Tax=Ectopseudomonas composti TaxID=658457 RepID=A0A1I5RLC4_9GAMM|nr:P-loop NTPase fold protein [Pseudomonas composti]SFP59345.1 KAP family P-loop domain-containing protein [Pseudomonas composti]
MSPNDHISKFLMEYCFLKTAPQYAVLLKGSWGSGKTWFIQKTIKQIRERDGKELYVSLYGVNSFSAIEEEFYRQLHPILSSKGMALTGKIITGLAKATLKIDFNQDGKDDGSLNVSVPDIKIPDYLTNTAGLVLIFDDLERCSIPINEVLGYINHFVEHQDYKVILVANETEILLEVDGNHARASSYKRIKEKLIGKSFEIQSDVDSAILGFVNEIGAKAQPYLHLETIKETYTQSTYNNLRHLRQALWDFSRLHEHLTHEAAKSTPLVTHLLKFFLALSCEIRQGLMSAKDITSFRADYITYLVRLKANNIEEPLVVKLKQKYPNMDVNTLLLEPKTWEDILDNSVINPTDIAEQLNNSHYLISKNTPDWVKLWHYNNLQDQEFEQLLERVRIEVSRRSIRDADTLKHIYGIFFNLSEKSIITDNPAQLLEDAKKYIDELKLSNQIDANERHNTYSTSESSRGLGYQGRETPEFKELSNYIIDRASEVYIESLPNQAKELLEILKSDPAEFSKKLFHSNTGDSRYFEIPILEYIDPTEFVTTLTSIDRSGLYPACYFLKERYSIPQFNKSLASELGWLKEVRTKLDALRTQNIGKLSHHIYGWVIENHINNGITQLENSLDPNQSV